MESPQSPGCGDVEPLCEWSFHAYYQRYRSVLHARICDDRLRRQQNRRGRSGRLFQESEPGKAGIEHLKQLEAAMQEQLKTAQGMIEKAPNDEALRARFQKTFVGYQQIVNAEQQKVVQQINGLMQKTLEDFRTKNGYSVIMNAEGLLAFDPKSDVTKDVIAEMDKTKVTFAPVKLEPITAAPKADDKAAPKADAKPEAKK